MAWFRDGLGNALNKWPVKVLVILVFLAYLGGAGYGVSRIQEGLQRKKLSKPDSYSIEFYEREDYYFREYPYRIQVRIFKFYVSIKKKSFPKKLRNLIVKIKLLHSVSLGR